MSTSRRSISIVAILLATALVVPAPAPALSSIAPTASAVSSASAQNSPASHTFTTDIFAADSFAADSGFDYIEISATSSTSSPASPITITLTATLPPAPTKVASASAKRMSLIKKYVKKLAKSANLNFRFVKKLCPGSVCGNVTFTAFPNAKLKSYKRPTMNLDSDTTKYATSKKITKLGKSVLAHETAHVVQAKSAQLRFKGLNGLKKWLRAHGFTGKGNLPLEKAADAMSYVATGKILGIYLKGKPKAKQITAAKAMWRWFK